MDIKYEVGGGLGHRRHPYCDYQLGTFFSLSPSAIGICLQIDHTIYIRYQC